MLIYDNTIDKRTVAGKMLVRRIKSMDKNRMAATARNLGGIAPELIMLRVKDIQEFLFNFSIDKLN